MRRGLAEAACFLVLLAQGWLIREVPAQPLVQLNAMGQGSVEELLGPGLMMIGDTSPEQDDAADGLFDLDQLQPREQSYAIQKGSPSSISIGGTIPDAVLKEMLGIEPGDDRIFEDMDSDVSNIEPLLAHMMTNMPGFGGQGLQIRSRFGQPARRGHRFGFGDAMAPGNFAAPASVPRSCFKDHQEQCMDERFPLRCLARHMGVISDMCKVDLFLTPCRNAVDKLCNMLEEGILTCLHNHFTVLDSGCQGAVKGTEKAIALSHNSTGSARVQGKGVLHAPALSAPQGLASTDGKAAASEAPAVAAAPAQEGRPRDSASAKPPEAAAASSTEAPALREKELDARVAATAAKPAAKREKELDARVAGAVAKSSAVTPSGALAEAAQLIAEREVKSKTAPPALVVGSTSQASAIARLVPTTSKATPTAPSAAPMSFWHNGGALLRGAAMLVVIGCVTSGTRAYYAAKARSGSSFGLLMGDNDKFP